MHLVLTGQEHSGTDRNASRAFWDAAGAPRGCCRTRGDTGIYLRDIWDIRFQPQGVFARRLEHSFYTPTCLCAISGISVPSDTQPSRDIGNITKQRRNIVTCTSRYHVGFIQSVRAISGISALVSTASRAFCRIAFESIKTAPAYFASHTRVLMDLCKASGRPRDGLN